MNEIETKVIDLFTSVKPKNDEEAGELVAALIKGLAGFFAFNIRPEGHEECISTFTEALREATEAATKLKQLRHIHITVVANTKK